MDRRLTPDMDAKLANSVLFVSDFMEVAMNLLGHTSIRAHDRVGPNSGYVIMIGGNLKIEGKDKLEAFSKLFKILASEKPHWTQEELDNIALEQVERDRREFQELLEVLTEGGMSDVGKEIQQVREETKEGIRGALISIKEEFKRYPRDIEKLMAEVRERSGIQSLELEEVLSVVRELTILEQER